MTAPKPKVSILLITYNHEKFIAQAIESILAQETEYSYVINVIEDCSTDRTQEIIMGYVEKYPDKVIPYFNAVNIGHTVTQKNFTRGFRTMNGEYLAILEGDDYWDSPHKLQKQVAFLEANPDYVAASHNTMKIYEDGSQESHRFLYTPNMKTDHTIEDMIYVRSFFHTTTLMYRNVFKGVPPKQFINPWSCDIFITIAHTQFGKIRYFDEDMAVYRAHAGGRFSGMQQLDGWMFNIGGLRRYNQWLGYRYAEAFAGSITRYCDVLLRGAGRNGVRGLTVLETMKYLLIRLGYSFLLQALRIPKQFRAWRSRLIPAAAKQSKPLYWASSAVLGVPLLALLVAKAGIIFILSNLYAYAMALMPSKVKNRIKAYEDKHPAIRPVRVFFTSGHFKSKEGRAAIKRKVLSIMPFGGAARTDAL